ncbi:MAG: mycofactocin biosynthesis glycosyltransferase MftF [Solirubrobacteraceae bacterium]
MLDRDARRWGATLAGGSPWRVIRLTAAGWRALEQLEQGAGTSDATLALGHRLIDAGLAHPRPPRRDGVAGVTIVVPVHDRAAELDRCLTALGSQAPVIVVDDGSRDRRTVAAVAARHGAKIVHRTTCSGPAAARNAALPEVETELIAFLDSDCVAERGWLGALVGHFEDPRVGAVAPRVRALAAGGSLARYLAARSPLDMGDRQSAVMPGGPVSYLPTAALLVRRRALSRGFDERLRYGEDVDLIWHLWDSGWRIRYDPAVTVAHREPERLHEVLARRFRYGTSAAPLANRHPGRLAPAVLPPWPTCVVVLILAGRPGAAALLAGRQSSALAGRLAALGLPRGLGARWFGKATYYAAVSLSQYVAMFAAPLVAAALFRARRPWPLALLALPALDGWWRRSPRLDPIRWTALWLADDAAYGAGVYWGCIKTATVGPLIPARSARPAAGS